MAVSTPIFNFHFTSNPNHTIGFRLLKLRSEIEQFIRFYKQPIRYIDCYDHFEWPGDPTLVEDVHNMVVQHLSENLFECCDEAAQLPAFLYVSEFAGTAKAMEAIIEKYGGNNWEFEGVSISDELHREINFGNSSRVPLFVREKHSPSGRDVTYLYSDW